MTESATRVLTPVGSSLEPVGYHILSSSAVSCALQGGASFHPPSAAVRHTHTVSPVSQVRTAILLAEEGGGYMVAAVLRIASIGSDSDDLTGASC
ncbi:hypothetical protein Baya_5202 [Bagarius yarrelli]|uniref:Uncharacterized protein n=1 Tax=Bagarius yarrelli TaxID=175774 RepID=A0A556TU08_BAGYA|nr:hypothetical protein Baya_5202 [Bagarius yarrelli]